VISRRDHEASTREFFLFPPVDGYPDLVGIGEHIEVSDLVVEDQAKGGRNFAGENDMTSGAEIISLVISSGMGSERRFTLSAGAAGFESFASFMSLTS